MIFKFKNGYQVQIRDCAGKSREELIEIAKKAVKDAVSLEKRIDTNVSFMPTKMKAAIEAEDKDMFDREYRFLRRDIDADLSESHKNYPKVYRKEVLEKLIKQYEDAGKLVRKADAAFDTALADQFDKDVEQLKINWALKEVKPFYVKIVYANGEVTTKEVASAEEGEADIQKRIKAGKKDGNAVLTATIIENGTEAVVKEITPEDVGVKDSNNIPPYRVKITYADGEVTIKYEDNLTAAVKDIRRRIEAGKKDGNAVAVALVYDSMTDEIVLSSDRDEDIRVKDAEKPKFRAYIKYVDLGARKKEFDTIEQAREELERRIHRSKRVGEPIVEAYIENVETGEVEQLYKNKDLLKDSKRTKDAPPPYYDPTDYPSIKSDYSVERIGREARHMDKDDPILTELDEVKAEIDELIAKGSEALIDAGWSKADARQAIANRYVALEKELRQNKLIDKARELHVKIRALEKAWDLRV